MSHPLDTPPDYRQWLGTLKTRFRQVQLKTAVAVNTGLLGFYWALGADIVAQQASQAWGSGFLERLSQDLMQEFPEVKGFSKRNLEQVRRWYLFWRNDMAIAKQPASQLFGIPWWHHVTILSKCRNPAEALYYVQQTQAHGWSRAVLTHQMESGLWQCEGQAQTNFAQTLPTPQSVDFEPEFAGKLNFYLKAVDEQLRGEGDAPTIGLLLCKSKDKLVAEYALSDIQKPLGLATYTLSHTLPEALRDKLPSIEALEAELASGLGETDE